MKKAKQMMIFCMLILVPCILFAQDASDMIAHYKEMSAGTEKNFPQELEVLMPKGFTISAKGFVFKETSSTFLFAVLGGTRKNDAYPKSGYDATIEIGVMAYNPQNAAYMKFLFSINNKKIIALYSLLMLLSGLIIFLLLPISKDRLKAGSSLIILSAENTLLRHFQTAGSAYSDWAQIQEFPQFLIDTTIQAEDKRFFKHIGFDPLSTARALRQNLSGVRVVSGGSTITQQLARTIYKNNLPSNKYIRKFFEIILAVRLEIHLSKNEILEAYLNRIPLKFN